MSKLIAASQLGDYKRVIYYIKQGININYQNEKRQTALMVAAKFGHYKIVSYLLNCGADNTLYDLFGRNALYFAKEWIESFPNDVELVIKLIQPTDNLDDLLYWAIKKDLSPIVSHLLTLGVHYDGINPNRTFTPLMYAAKYSSFKSAKIFIGCGAIIDFQNSSGNTALIEASIVQCTTIINLLLESGANVNVQNNSRNTPLIYICQKGNSQIAKLYIDYGADINHKNIDDKSALYYTIYYKRRQCAELLLDMNIQIDDQVLNMNKNDCPSNIKNKIHWHRYRKNWMMFLYQTKFLQQNIDLPKSYVSSLPSINNDINSSMINNNNSLTPAMVTTPTSVSTSISNITPLVINSTLMMTGVISDTTLHPPPFLSSQRPNLHITRTMIGIDDLRRYISEYL